MTVLHELSELRSQALAELASAASADQLERWRIRYLGTKGQVRAVMNRLKEVPRQLKPQFGQAANQLKDALQGAYEARLAETSSRQQAGGARAADVTLPGQTPRIGHVHVMTQTIQELCDIFGRMGFEVVYGPEVEDERHNFDALNIPRSHVARDELNNFYINPRAMLRSQTSTVQIRVMENQQPPVRIISAGRVYRPDTVDAMHSFMFHQVEGLYVDEGVSMADLKTTLDQFCKAYFGLDIQTRFRPSYFPFTEPSAEVDILFRNEDGSTRWLELGGCGMVHPNVLAAVGYDAEEHTGFAFGLGIERMVMRRHNIPDIRLLYEGDARFVRQF